MSDDQDEKAKAEAELEEVRRAGGLYEYWAKFLPNEDEQVSDD